jgi:hypothetical protein
VGTQLGQQGFFLSPTSLLFLALKPSARCATGPFWSFFRWRCMVGWDGGTTTWYAIAECCAEKGTKILRVKFASHLVLVGLSYLVSLSLSLSLCRSNNSHTLHSHTPCLSLSLYLSIYLSLSLPLLLTLCSFDRHSIFHLLSIYPLPAQPSTSPLPIRPHPHFHNNPFSLFCLVLT